MSDPSQEEQTRDEMILDLITGYQICGWLLVNSLNCTQDVHNELIQCVTVMIAVLFSENHSN